MLLLKVVYLYQDYNSTENQVPLIYGMTYTTNRNRKERYKLQNFANIFEGLSNEQTVNDSAT